MSHDKPVDFSAVPPRVAPPVFLIEYHSCTRGGKKKSYCKEEQYMVSPLTGNAART